MGKSPKNMCKSFLTAGYVVQPNFQKNRLKARTGIALSKSSYEKYMKRYSNYSYSLNKLQYLNNLVLAIAMSKTLRGDYNQEKLETLYKNCKEIDLKTRILAIKLIYSGWKATEIGEHLSVSYKTIYNWIDLWNEGGIEKLRPQKRGKRRKPYINKDEWLIILEEIKGKGYNLSQVGDYIEQTRGIKSF